MTTTERRLRDYQAEDIERVRAAWHRGVARPAIVWATGLGKTDPVAFLAAAEMHELTARLAADEVHRGGHVVLLAHRDFLLTQLRDRVHAYDPGIRVGRVQAGSREYSAPIIVATVQTASRAATLARLRRPTLVIVDEAHHAAAKTYERIMRALGCYDEINPTRALGVTATMARQRGAGLGLGDVWQEIVATRSIAWGIEHGPDPADPYRTLPVGDDPGQAPRGWLVPLFGRQVVAEHVDLSKAKVNKAKGDYADAGLGEMVSQDAPEIVKAWWTEALLPDGSHRQTAVFVPSIAAAHATEAAFTAAGITAETVTGTTPPTSGATSTGGPGSTAGWRTGGHRCSCPSGCSPRVSTARRSRASRSPARPCSTGSISRWSAAAPGRWTRPSGCATTGRRSIRSMIYSCSMWSG